MNAPRLILLHKQKTSGRVRFLRLPDGVICFDALPPQASLREEDYQAAVLPHPSALMQAAAARFKLDGQAIQAEGEFIAWVDTPKGEIPVLLGSFATVDPPFEAAAALGGEFIAITEARRLPELDRQLMRRAYEHVLG